MQSYSHHELGQFSELFTDEDEDALFDWMDERQNELKKQGYRMTKRVKVGRNAPCPCGSGVKFKKCCIFRVKRGEPLEIRK